MIQGVSVGRFSFIHTVKNIYCARKILHMVKKVTQIRHICPTAYSATWRYACDLFARIARVNVMHRTIAQLSILDNKRVTKQCDASVFQ